MSARERFARQAAKKPSFISGIQNEVDPGRGLPSLRIIMHVLLCVCVPCMHVPVSNGRRRLMRDSIITSSCVYLHFSSFFGLPSRPQLIFPPDFCRGEKECDSKPELQNDFSSYETGTPCPYASPFSLLLFFFHFLFRPHKGKHYLIIHHPLILSLFLRRAPNDGGFPFSESVPLVIFTWMEEGWSLCDLCLSLSSSYLQYEEAVQTEQ